MAKVSNIQAPADAGKRAHSEVRFPASALAESLAVANVIHQTGGGRATADQLAAFLNYKSTHNGAFLARVGAARQFGLIEKNGQFFVITPLATRILMPTYPEQARQGLVMAFMNIALFKRVYDDFQGKELPTGFGMKNALRNIYGVVPNRVDRALRSLMESADAAGFFATRGTRTHLIMPAVQPASDAIEDADWLAIGGGSGRGGSGSGGGSGGGLPPKGPDARPPAAVSIEAVKARYVETLIKALEEKGKSGDLDPELMERIEKLLKMGEQQ